MGLDRTFELVDEITDLDARRRETFRAEYDQYVDGDLEEFSETRSVLAEERARVTKLSDQLARERNHLEELVDETEYLTAEQATRHREQALEKLSVHNEHLETFQEAMAEALDRIATNLDALETEGEEAVSEDPEPCFEEAQDAIDAHNDAIDGLGTNMQILNAYLI